MFVNRQQQRWVRKTHRFLGLFLGVQFLMWTVSGLYFSYSNRGGWSTSRNPWS